MTENPNIHEIGTVPDFAGDLLPVRRDYDGLDLSGVKFALLPSGVRELEKRIAEYWTEMARWRAGRLDLGSTGIDIDDARETLATFPGVGDAADFTSVDWHEVGRRLAALERNGYGSSELARLHALLVSDDPKAERL